MPKTIAILGLLFLVSVLVSAPQGEAPLMIEVTLYVSGQFQSGVCRSPDVFSPAPYWSVNDNILNDKELNLLYGATVSRDYDGDGRYLATLSIPSLNLTLNDSRISCSVNMTVLLQYHLHLIDVEAELVYLPTKQFSVLCTSPSNSSLGAPYFKFNNISLNSVTVNEFYGANVMRNISQDGHRQALLIITGGNATLNDSIVTCLVNSTVIWRVQLIINDNPGTTTTSTSTSTTATMETGAITDGITQTISAPESPKSGGQSELSKGIIPSMSALLVLPLLVLVIISVVIGIYLYKQGKCERTTRHEDNCNSSVGRSPDDASQTSASPPTIIVVPQVPDSESQGSPVNTEPVTVTGVSRSGRTPRHQRVPSLLRYSDGNIGCSVDDPANLPALDTTTSTYLHSLNNTFASETGQDESNVLQLSREEESRSELGQSLAVPCISGLDCKDVYKSFIKGWDDSSRGQCQYVANGLSDEHDNGNQAYSAV